MEYDTEWIFKCGGQLNIQFVLYIFMTAIIYCTNKYEFGNVGISNAIIPETVKVNDEIRKNRVRA
jgi:hypothetical protein